MSENINEVTLQSTDGTLIAQNDGNNNLVYPMLHLDRQPTQNDINMLDSQGWDSVLICVDGDPEVGKFYVSEENVTLGEENNYFRTVGIFCDEHEGWTVSDVDENYIKIDSTSGVLVGYGNARLDITKAAGLTTPGEYPTFFTITQTSSGNTIRINVFIDVSVPLDVNPITIPLNVLNGYTNTITVNRDRHWHLEGVDNELIEVSLMEGSGEPPGYERIITVTKSPTLVNDSTTSESTPTTTFDVVSGIHRIAVTVNITIPKLPTAPVVFAFIDPPAINSEVGVLASQQNIYIYV